MTNSEDREQKECRRNSPRGDHVSPQPITPAVPHLLGDDSRQCTSHLILACLIHEMNRPLSTLQLLIEKTALKDEAGSDREGSLTAPTDGLQEQVNRLRHLLGLGQLFASGTVLFNVVPTSVNDIVEASCEIGADILHECRLELHLSPERPFIEIPPYVLEAIVRNLLTNACDSLLQEGVCRAGEMPTITICTDVLHRDGQRTTLLSVRDNGRGIPQEVLERFTQAMGDSSNFQQGNGLGLLIVKAVVEQFGGRMDITTSPEAGTTVALSFSTGPSPNDNEP